MKAAPPVRSGNSRLYGTLFLVMAVLLALFWSVHPFFMWVLIGGLAVLSFLYYRALPKTKPDDRYQRGEETGTGSRPEPPLQGAATRPQKKKPHQPDPKAFTPQQKTKFIGLAAVVLAAVVVLSIMVLIISVSDEAEPTTGPEAYQQTLAANPNDIDALTNLGNFYFDQLAYDSALSYYNRVLRVDARNSSALYNKGLVYYKQQQYETSVSVLRQCVDADAGNLDALVVLGHNYYDRQQYGPAQDWYRKAYDGGLRDSFVCHALAWLHDQKSQTSEALAFYKEAVSLDSTRADIYTRLAELEPARASTYRALEQRWKQVQ